MVFGGEFEPVSAIGTVLERGDGGDPTETFYPIADILSITGPGMELATIDASTITSPNQHVQYLPGQVKSGKLSLSVNFIPKHDSHVGLINDLKTRALRNFRLVIPDGEQSVDADSTLNQFWSFAAYVTRFSPNIQLGDRISATIELTVDGELEITT